MLVSTNTIFLEDDYVTNFKPRIKVILEELRGNVIAPQPIIVVEIRKKENSTSLSQNIMLSGHIGRTVG